MTNDQIKEVAITALGRISVALFQSGGDEGDYLVTRFGTRIGHGELASMYAEALDAELAALTREADDESAVDLWGDDAELVRIASDALSGHHPERGGIEREQAAFAVVQALSFAKHEALAAENEKLRRAIIEALPKIDQAHDDGEWREAGRAACVLRAALTREDNA